MEGFQKAPLQGGCGAKWVRCSVAQYLVRRRVVLEWVAQSPSVGSSSSSGVEGVGWSLWLQGRCQGVQAGLAVIITVAVEYVNTARYGRMCDAPRAPQARSGRTGLC